MKTIGISKQNLSYHQKIVCAQIHPDEECFALGTQSGRIALRFEGKRSLFHSLIIVFLLLLRIDMIFFIQHQNKRKLVIYIGIPYLFFH